MEVLNICSFSIKTRHKNCIIYNIFRVLYFLDFLIFQNFRNKFHPVFISFLKIVLNTLFFEYFVVWVRLEIGVGEVIANTWAHFAHRFNFNRLNICCLTFLRLQSWPLQICQLNWSTKEFLSIQKWLHFNISLHFARWVNISRRKVINQNVERRRWKLLNVVALEERQRKLWCKKNIDILILIFKNNFFNVLIAKVFAIVFLVYFHALANLGTEGFSVPTTDIRYFETKMFRKSVDSRSTEER